MEITLKIVAFLVAVFILILVHECGHFLVARCFKVKILRFSIGFGKALYKWFDRQGTEYVIALIPLGGYVKMLDSREMPVVANEKHLAFDYKPIWQRMLIILAGPITNIIFAFIMFWLLFTIGFTAPKPIIGEVVPQSLADLSGLKAQDEIISVGKKETSDWQKVTLVLFSHIGDKTTLPIKVQRVIKNGGKKISTDKDKEGETKTETKLYQLDLHNWRLDEWQPDPLKDLGIIPYQPFIPLSLGEIGRGSPAAKAGLKINDKVLAINGQSFADWEKMVEFIKQHPKQKLLFLVERNQQRLNINVTTGWKFGPRWRKIGYLGIKPISIEWPKKMINDLNYSWFGAFPPAWQQSYEFLAFNGIILTKLILGKISLHVIGGPIAIFQSAALALQRGIIVYLGFLALLSLMLAFVNLLPIPALDGGYILFLLYEIISRRSLSIATQELVLRLGLIFLVILMLQGMINDLKRIFL